MSLKRGDMVAGISVAAIAIPQSLAYAEIAGMPVHIGLYAAAIPPIVAAFFASSRYLQTGPVAMTGLLTFGALSSVQTPGTPGWVEAGILLALVVGVVRVLLGLLNAGVLAYLMSQPVLLGFSSAAAILIVASQVEVVLGLEQTSGPLLGRAVSGLCLRPADWNPTAILVATIAATAVVLGKRVHRLFPAILIVVVAAVLVNRVFELNVETVGTIPEGLPKLGFQLPWNSITSLLIPGIVIAVVGFAEPAAIARTLAAQDRQAWNPDREFLSQGVANIGSALVGSFPVGGSFSRSAVAKLAGAQTRFTGLVGGIIVFAFLPFASLLEALPRAVLGAIVIVATVRLIRLRALFRMIRITWGQSFVAWATFCATLIFSPRVDLGLIVGVVLAVAIHLRRESKLRLESELKDGTLQLIPSGVLYFGSAPGLSQVLIDQLAVHDNDSIDRVIVNLSELGRVDYTGVLELKAFFDDCEAAGLKAGFSEVPEHAVGSLRRALGTDFERFQITT
jgi:SulP family sulfate permease